MSTVTTPRELRPRGRWYAVAAAVAVVGVAVGVVVFLTQLRSWTEQFPRLGLLRNLALRIAISAVPVVIGLGAAAALFIGVARRRRAHRREATGSAQRSAQRSA